MTTYKRTGWLLLVVAFALATLPAARSEEASLEYYRLGLPALTSTQRASPELISLGQRLFFDKRLSADGKVSCSTCHKSDRLYTDGNKRSIGQGGRVGTRNAPSLLNVLYATSLFWDGRASDLESQALAPLTNPVEHGLASQGVIVKIVGADAAYPGDFARVFKVTPPEISAELVTRAIATFERSLIAGGSPFDRFQYGHDPHALSAAAVRGLDLFVGRARCGSCHLIGPNSALLTDGQFHMAPVGLSASVNTNLVRLTQKVLTARRDPNAHELERLIATDAEVAALGRFLKSLNPLDIGKFKTPSLRDVALTAPYMHDGSVGTLESAVDLELYGRGAVLDYPIALTLDEKRDLIEFLRALTSPYARGDTSHFSQGDGE
jgi:cytochrome c peroxidase